MSPAACDRLDHGGAPLKATVAAEWLGVPVLGIAGAAHPPVRFNGLDDALLAGAAPRMAPHPSA